MEIIETHSSELINLCGDDCNNCWETCNINDIAPPA